LNHVESALATLLDQHGWRVTTEPADRPEFSVLAENAVAVLFAASVRADDVSVDVGRLAGLVSSSVMLTGGPKAWEAVLVLLAFGMRDELREAAARAERDLTYCRKVVIDAAVVESSEDPPREIERELAFLFPLAIRAEEQGMGPLNYLQVHLESRGHPPALIHALVEDFESEADHALLRIENFLSETDG